MSLVSLSVHAVTPPASAPRLERIGVEHVSLGFGPVTAVDDVSLRVAEGEILCLLGPSGSGKSTLLRLLAGLERPSSGRILLEGVEVAGPGRFVEAEARRVGMVFQDYALFPHLTVAANVAFGLTRRPKKEAETLVESLLARLGMSAYADRYPHLLSGGERQRVALARALAPSPRVLLMDEPFSSLDERLRHRVRQETVDLLREVGTTTVVVTHDPDEAMHIGDRIALLRAGRLVQCDSPERLYTQPATLFAARFLSEVNEIPGTCRGGCVETLFGRLPAPHLPDGAPAVACVRPQHMRLTAQASGVSARVISATFLGEMERLMFAVPDLERPVMLRTCGRTRLTPGNMVHLDVHPHDVVVLPRDEA